MKFEWDEGKREANLVKHGLDLMAGAALFDGRPVLRTSLLALMNRDL